MDNQPIPYAVAKRITIVLGDVMRELRALREIAYGSVDSSMASDALANATIAICERAHLMVDRCQIKLGGPAEGNYNIDELLEPQESEARDGQS
jgi:hypothetical protein